MNIHKTIELSAGGPGSGRHAEGIAKLQKLGIKNTKHLDDWITKNPTTETHGPYKGQKSLHSRYSALVHLVGKETADAMMTKLEQQRMFEGLPNKGKK